jgi:hypothetical protein
MAWARSDHRVKCTIPQRTLLQVKVQLDAHLSVEPLITLPVQLHHAEAVIVMIDVIHSANGSYDCQHVYAGQRSTATSCCVS